MLPSGEQIAIAHGDQRAVSPKSARRCAPTSRAGSASIEGFAGEEVPTHARGQVLYPWPNRIGEASGPSRDGPACRPSTTSHSDTAIHGLIRWRPFRIESVNQNRCVLSSLLHPTPDYPFLSEISVAYHLGSTRVDGDDDGDQSRRRAHSLRRGFHPYVAVTTPTIEGALARDTRPRSYVAVNERQLPTGEILPLAGHQLDFTKRKSLSGHELDVTYTDLVRDDSGLAVAYLEDARGGEVELSVDRNFPYFQVYTGDHLEKGRRRTSVAIEPMTCPPDALRSGKDVVVLEPGQHWAGSWRLRRLA